MPINARMGLSAAVRAVQGDVGKANCAGRGCPDRRQCRRFQVRIVGPSRVRWEEQYGQWVSADVERKIFGTCALFVRWRRPEKRKVGTT